MEKVVCMIVIILLSAWNVRSTETLFEKLIEYSEKEHGKKCDTKEISVKSCDQAIENNIAESSTVCTVNQSQQAEYVVCDNGIWRPLGWVTDERQTHREKRDLFAVFVVAVAVCILFCPRSGGSSENRRVEQRTTPVITCPIIPKNFDCPPRKTSIIVTWQDATAEDEEDRKYGKKPHVTQIHGNASGSRFSQGDTIVYKAVDSHGDSATCSFTFKVTVITCSALDWPDNGRKICDLERDIYGTVCTFTCNEGYDLHGNMTSVCQSSKTYTNQPPSCVPITCDKPQSPDNGQVVCSNSSYYFKSHCHVQCNSGYTVETNTVIRCNADRTWSSTLPKCTDSEPPVIQFCPSTISVHIDRGTDTAYVTWDPPIFTDNAGLVFINQTKGPLSGSLFSVGGTEVRYEAKDDQGNLSPYCTFFVFVNALTCQQNLQDDKLRYNCPDNNFNYGSTCELSCHGNYPLVGNSSITCEKNETTDSAEAFWSWGTDVEPYCQEITCPPINPPQNGALACDMNTVSTFCTMLCNANFDFPIGTIVGQMYVCRNSRTWIPEVPVPGCTALRHPRYTVLPGELYYYTGNCEDNETQNAIREQFIQLSQTELISQNCPTSGCNITSVVVTCGPTGGRRRRSAHKSTNINHINIIQSSGIIRERRTKRSTQTSHEIKLAYVITMDYLSNGNDYYGIHDLMKEFQNATIEQAIASGELNIGNISVSGSTVGWTDFECPEGQKFRYQTFSCASCSAGSFFNKSADDCSKCPIGTYQDQDGSLACKQCPIGTSTVEIGTVNSTDCLEICTEGSFSKTGLSPCFKCLQGQYQGHKQSKSCENCQKLQTTLTTGSTKASDCTDFDIILKRENSTIDIGIQTQNFTVAFWILRRYSDRIQTLEITGSSSQTGCKLSFSNTTTAGINGIETDVSSIGKQTHWNHITFQANTVSGDLTVFLNGQNIFLGLATSFINVTDIKLFVPEFQLSGFAVYPHLLPNANVLALSKTCSANLSSYSIQTIDDLKILPYSQLVIPSTCTVIDRCEDNPCNGHACIDKLNEFTCICKNGYSGATCSNPPDYCVDNNCRNGATCVEQNGTYSCICNTGFKGIFCENAIVNGNWNSWQQWSECTKSCGGGIRSRNRTCDNPPPDDEGLSCFGDETYTETCNTQTCPDGGCCMQDRRNSLFRNNRPHFHVESSSVHFVSPYTRSSECPPFAYLKNYGNLFTCNYVNGYSICNVTCRTGLIFPNGNYHVYRCGENTSFEWQQKPPACLDANSPVHMALKASASISSFPCSGIEEAKSTYKSNIDKLWCRRSGTCSVNITTGLCNLNMRRKRSLMSNLNIDVTMSIQVENQPLDLVSYFENGTVSPALSSFIDAYNELETTAQEMNNLSSTIFAVNVSDVAYNIDGNTINLEPSILCAVGTVLHEGVCAQCPRGTRYSNGLCVYCDEGAYQHLTGQAECTSCPYGFTTQFKGSTSILDCRVPGSTTSVDVTTFSTIGQKHNNEDIDSSKTGIIVGVIVSSVIFLFAVFVGFILRKMIRKRMLFSKKAPSVLSIRKINPEVVPSPPKEMYFRNGDNNRKAIGSHFENWFQNEDFKPPVSHKLPPLDHSFPPLHIKLPPLDDKK